jgi:undecaprenyl diphosphate synthase
MTRTLHIGLIMDGNGRWAEKRRMPRTAGHRAGVRSIQKILECAPQLGVRTLTIYAFSADNWRRPESEVSALMQLLRSYLIHETTRCLDRGVRLEFLGRRDRLAPSLVEVMETAEDRTRQCCGLTLRIAIDYSSRDAIVAAAQKMAHSGDFSRESMSGALGAEDLDLVIRTAGEQRLSDFLLWECAYAEFVFTDRLWPDFQPADLENAIEIYKLRNRKFGGLAAKAS